MFTSSGNLINECAYCLVTEDSGTRVFIFGEKLTKR